MPKALFLSFNLIGDSLNCSPALQAWHKANPENEIHVLTSPDHTAALYSRMGVPVKVFTDAADTEPPYNFQFIFDCGYSFKVGDEQKCHQVEAYAKMLGVEIDTVTPTYIPDEDPQWLATQPSNVILVSMFSRSCSSHSGLPPNKSLPWPKWVPILRYLRSFNLPLRFLGAKDDRTDELSISEEEWLTGEDLNRVALLMRDKAVLLVTIDNGMGHLGATQQVPTFLLYPACLGTHWIIPSNPDLMPVQMDPAQVQPTGLLWAAKQAIPELLKVRLYKEIIG